MPVIFQSHWAYDGANKTIWTDGIVYFFWCVHKRQLNDFYTILKEQHRKWPMSCDAGPVQFVALLRRHYLCHHSLSHHTTRILLHILRPHYIWLIYPFSNPPSSTINSLCTSCFEKVPGNWLELSCASYWFYAHWVYSGFEKRNFPRRFKSPTWSFTDSSTATTTRDTRPSPPRLSPPPQSRILLTPSHSSRNS